MYEIGGILAPVTTPFDPVTGDLDVVALRANVRALADSAPLSGFVLLGTTGEGLLLDVDERAAAISAVREIVAEGIVIAAVGAESTRAAVRLARLSAEAGADAVLVAPPTYYRPQLTPEALRLHYAAIANDSPVPLLLYQVPRAYAGVELRAGLVAELANHPNVVGIKDSTGDLHSIGELVATCDRDFAVLVGSGAVLYGALEIGARGGILAVADIAPADCCALYRLQRAGDDVAAGAIQERLERLHKRIVSAHGVPGVKAALDLIGQAGGPPRPPLRPLNDRDRREVRAALFEAGLVPGAEAIGPASGAAERNREEARG